MAKIPAFPDFRPICLTDREQLENAFRRMQPEVSEFNFTNLFMFRHVHDYRAAEHNGNVVIIAKSYGGQPYCMPPIGDGKIPETVDALFEFMRREDLYPSIELAPKEFVEGLPGGRYSVEGDPDNADYVYLTRELINLSGRKFHD